MPKPLLPTHSWVVLNNVEMAVTTWGQANPEQPPVICWHGMTRNGRDFDRLAVELAKDRLVICPDTPGRGLSPWLTDKSLYAYTHYFDLAHTLIDHFELTTFDWVGTSMGGRIGMGIGCPLYNPRPIQLRRLVLNDIGPNVPIGARQRIAKYVSNPPVQNSVADLLRAMRVIYRPYGVEDESFWQHLLTHTVRVLPDGRVTMNYDPDIGYALSAPDGDNFERQVWKEYAAIPCPILVYHGVKSDLLTQDTVDRMVAEHPNTQVFRCEKAGHTPVFDIEARISPIIDFFR